MQDEVSEKVVALSIKTDVYKRQAVKRTLLRHNSTEINLSKKVCPPNRGTSAKHYLKENIKIH